MKGFFHVAAPFVLDGISMSGNIYGDVLGVSTKEQIEAQQVLSMREFGLSMRGVSHEYPVDEAI